MRRRSKGIMSDTKVSKAEEQAQKLIRRHKRNMRKATAEGFLAGVAAMLRPGDLVMDCGANLGVVTEVLAATPADVMAFEPDPWAFGKLQKAFGDHPRVTLINAAVGAKAGTVKLMRAENFDDNPTGASVKSTILDGGRAIDAGNHVEVELVDFPQLVADTAATRGEIAFVKMDIEGAELEILETLEARDLFGPIRSIVVETHERKFKELRPRFQDLRKRMAEAYPTSKVNLDWI